MGNKLLSAVLGGVLLVGGGLTAAQPAAGVKLAQVNRIWDEAPHNAFTDLVRCRDHWYCCFREGAGHAAGAGTIRVLTSDDGEQWRSAASFGTPGTDLRDPKLSVTPDGRLMMVGGAAVPASRDPVKDHYSFVSFSKDGLDWSWPQRVLDGWHWLWRITWHKGVAYGVAYQWDPKDPRNTRSYQATLYRSKDGAAFQKVVAFQIPNPTEAALAFEGDTMICLQRRDGQPNTAMLGRSEPPYTEWTWHDLGVSFGGPQLIRAPSGSWWAAGRLSVEGKPQTVLCRLDVKKGELTPLLTLPSGGDTSYPGLVWHRDLLWMSYYSSHERKSSIYLGRLQLASP